MTKNRDAVDLAWPLPEGGRAIVAMARNAPERCQLFCPV